MTDQKDSKIKDEHKKKPAEKDDLPGLPPRLTTDEPSADPPKQDELPGLPPR